MMEGPAFVNDDLIVKGQVGRKNECTLDSSSLERRKVDDHPEKAEYERTSGGRPGTRRVDRYRREICVQDPNRGSPWGKTKTPARTPTNQHPHPFVFEFVHKSKIHKEGVRQFHQPQRQR